MAEAVGSLTALKMRPSTVRFRPAPLRFRRVVWQILAASRAANAGSNPAGSITTFKYLGRVVLTMQTSDSQNIGRIGYFEVYHIPEEECFRVFTNRDEFEMELDVPESFEGNLSDVRDEIYPSIVNEHNEWLMEN